MTTWPWPARRIDTGDPFERMAATLQALDEHVRDAGTTSRRLESNRLVLLYVHAVSGILVGPLFYGFAMATGLDSASWRPIGEVGWAGAVLSLSIGLGGLILLVGTFVRSAPLVIAGLVGIAAWYATTAVVFLIAVAQWNAAGRQGTVPGTYAAIVYAHMSAVMSVHIWTVVRMARRRMHDELHL